MRLSRDVKLQQSDFDCCLVHAVWMVAARCGCRGAKPLISLRSCGLPLLEPNFFAPTKEGSK